MTSLVVHTILYFIILQALAIEDFYGRADSTTGEWSNGIFAALWCRANASDTYNTTTSSSSSCSYNSSSSSTAITTASAPTATETSAAATAVWIVCDGPVDSSWTDVLHSALNDSTDSSSRVLVLASGNRVPMLDTVKVHNTFPFLFGKLSVTAATSVYVYAILSVAVCTFACYCARIIAMLH
jgi:hypothetical protein